MYIEDLYDKSCQGDSISYVTKKDIHQLQNIIACPYVPPVSRYIIDVTGASCDIVEFEDVSEKWTQVVRARSDEYKASEKPSAALQMFYDAVAEISEGGHVGGVSLAAVR